MRRPIVAANWKMNKTIDEAIAYARDFPPRIASYSNVDIVICPSYIALASLAYELRGSPVKLGAQNVHYEAKGAYTSQISAAMLTGLAEYIIIGHSETRQYLGDTDAIVNQKIHAALNGGFKPILAVGESLAQNEAGETIAFVSGQVRAGLEDVTAEQMASVVIAYEPLWAINTGKSCDPDAANTTIGQAVRATLETLYGADVAAATRIQYGGSVKPGNIADYMATPEIDGALVGNASLEPADFAALVAITSQTRPV